MVCTRSGGSVADKQMMGEVLVELGLIDEHRLRHALEVSKKE